MTSFAGTGSLIRLVLRLDRVRLTVWVLIIALLPLATAAQYMKLYPDEATIRAVGGVLANPSLVAIGGPLFAETLGGLTAWKVGSTEMILAALMSLLTVIRHTRTEEETGRLELVGAAAIGRYAPLSAALLVVTAANGVIAVLIALGLIGTGLPATGSVAFGLAIGCTGLLFAGLAAAAAQLTEGARSAISIGAAVLGASYLLRAVGDTGPTWLSWSSPIGWAIYSRPFAAERWWVFVLITAVAVALIALAYLLIGRRDVNAGLLPQRPGPAEAGPSLSSPFGLAWRLHRGLFLGWAVALALSGAVLGGAADGISHATGLNQQISDVLDRLGGVKGLADAFLATTFGIIGLTAAIYTVQATLRLRAEENAGRLEPLLATRAGRIRWAASHLSFAVVGTGVLLVLAGAGAGLAYGAQVNDIGGQMPRLIAGALVQLPAAWVLAGFGTLLFGLLPRFAIVTWAALIACFVVLEVGALLGLGQWVMDVSPFAHVPKLPGSAFSATPLLWLTVIAAALGAVGLTGFRRRDIG